jgi:hypothetical protein
MFNADPAVIGRTVELDGNVVYGDRCDVARLSVPRREGRRHPVDANAWQVTSRGGVCICSRSSRDCERAFPSTPRIESSTASPRSSASSIRRRNAGFGVTVLPLRTALIGDVRRPILLLFAAVAAVLLIGCANVANLMLGRVGARRQELAVRVAMGAEPGVIARQMLTEAALIAVVAGVIGGALAVWGTRALALFIPPSIAKLADIRVDGTVLAFTLGASVIAALLCGLVPAFHASRGAAHPALKDSARGDDARSSSLSGRFSRWRVGAVTHAGRLGGTAHQQFLSARAVGSRFPHGSSREGEAVASRSGVQEPDKAPAISDGAARARAGVAGRHVSGRGVALSAA